jgi:glycosyltransferase involved in cell wall biosynthesis
MIFMRAPVERSGLDSFGPKTAQALTKQGLDSTFRNLWPAGLYFLFNSLGFPYGRTLFRKFASNPLALASLRKAQRGDIAWILSFCSPYSLSPLAEARLKSRGLRYVFHIMDDWFDIDNLRQGTIQRCQLANLVGVPTPYLRERVLEFVPEAKVAVFEEPIDLERLKGSSDCGLAEKPVILWCGNPFNLEHAEMLLGVLRQVHRVTPFVFRLICGQKPPQCFFDGLTTEWLPFCHEKEASLIGGSWFGIAPMPDSGHNRCKGAYKVKTYLASGLPVVASPIGFQKDLLDGGNGVGLLPTSTREWSDAILSLIQNRARVIEMGKKAELYARARFSYDAVGASWANILRAHDLITFAKG